MEDKIDSMHHLCRTAKFQSMVFQFFKAFIPIADETSLDIRFILMRWNCTLPGLCLSTAEPSPDVAAREPGIPVGLLPFVLDKALPPDADQPEFALYMAANELLCQFWDALGVARKLGRNATLEDFPTAQCAPLVEAAKEFVITYVRLTHPIAEEVEAMLRRVVPLAIQQMVEGGPEGARLYLKIKTLFFGLHGFSLTPEVIQGLVMMADYEESLQRQMQAVSLEGREQ